jgi:putative transposase
MGIDVSVPCWWEKAGWSVAQVQRVRRNEGLKVPSKPKRESRRGDSTGLLTKATYPNQVWTWDFIFDRTDKGSTLKMLTMLDEYTRQCWVIRVSRQIQSRQVFETLLQFMAIYGVPEHIRSDNGSKFIAHAIQQGLKDHQIKTLYIEPGSPWQNGFIERFHSRFWDECLNREWLLNLREARIVIEDWRLHYNKERPHSQLGYISPDEFRLNQKVSPQVGQNG